MAFQVAQAATGVIRDSHWAYNNQTLGRIKTLLLEGASTNLLPYSNDLSNAAWSKNGSPTESYGQLDPTGGSAATLVTSTVNGDNLAQTLTFTGNGVKAISAYIKGGTAAATDIGIYDNNAAAFVNLVRATWTAGVPALMDVTGTSTNKNVELISNGWYRISFSTATITAAHTNTYYIYPASSLTGSISTYCLQGENSAFVTSPIPTIAGSTVTRNADALSFPFTTPPQSLTIYKKYVALGQNASDGVIAIADNSTAGSLMVYYPTTTTIKGFFETSGGNVSTGTLTAPVLNDLVEVRLTLDPTGVITLGVTINGGAESVSTASSALAIPTVWYDNVIYPGVVPGIVGFNATVAAHVELGVQTLAYMRTAAGQ